MRRASEKHVFITGASGCLGAELVPRLLASNGLRATLLVRETASSERGKARFDCASGNIQCVTGDVVLPRLGLGEAQLRRLREEVDEVWHLAAETRFEEVLRPRIFKVNVEGARNMLRFAATLPRLRCFHHVSTAFVAGVRNQNDRVFERIHAKPKAFRNPYEESKYEAERLVRESCLPHIIYRPSIVLADPALGIDAGQTVYGVAKMARAAKLLGDREKNGGAGDAKTFRIAANAAAAKNIVPAANVADAMVGLAAAARPDGGVYHLAHPRPCVMADLMNSVAGLLDLGECVTVPELDTAAATAAERMFERMSRSYAPYMLRGDPAFDTSITRRALGGWDVPVVDRARLEDAVHRFFIQTYGEDYAGPRRQTAAVA